MRFDADVGPCADVVRCCPHTRSARPSRAADAPRRGCGEAGSWVSEMEGWSRRVSARVEGRSADAHLRRSSFRRRGAGGLPPPASAPWHTAPCGLPRVGGGEGGGGMGGRGRRSAGPAAGGCCHSRRRPGQEGGCSYPRGGGRAGGRPEKGRRDVAPRESRGGEALRLAAAAVPREGRGGGAPPGRAASAAAAGERGGGGGSPHCHRRRAERRPGRQRRRIS